MELINSLTQWTAAEIKAAIAVAGLAFAYYKLVFQHWDRRFDALGLRMDRARREAMERHAEIRAYLHAQFEHMNAQLRDINIQLRELNRRTAAIEEAVRKSRSPEEPEWVETQQVH